MLRENPIETLQGAVNGVTGLRHADFKVGIFSKFEYAGGSEFRCAEMANGIARVAGCSATLFAEKGIVNEVRRSISPQVEVVDRVCSKERFERLYEMDTLLVVNTDSKEFTRAEYWRGETPRHRQRIDLSRFRSVAFLFNFIVSPSRHLSSLSEKVPDLRIITANRKFYTEISEQDRYLTVRHYPRLCLESPIAPASVQFAKRSSAQIRLGAHSRASGSKWNPEWLRLVEEVDRRCGDRVAWEFMGMPKDLAESIRRNHIRIRREFEIPVGEFLRDLDVFVFFPAWNREEPWARSIAEAMVSGCPVLTTAKGGNQDQILHGNNGLICRSLQDFIAGCERLVGDDGVRNAMSRNAAASARAFHTDRVVRRYLDFITT